MIIYNFAQISHLQKLEYFIDEFCFQYRVNKDEVLVEFYLTLPNEHSLAKNTRSFLANKCVMLLDLVSEPRNLRQCVLSFLEWGRLERSQTLGVKNKIKGTSLELSEITISCQMYFIKEKLDFIGLGHDLGFMFSMQDKRQIDKVILKYISCSLTRFEYKEVFLDVEVLNAANLLPRVDMLFLFIRQYLSAKHKDWIEIFHFTVQKISLLKESYLLFLKLLNWIKLFTEYEIYLFDILMALNAWVKHKFRGTIYFLHLSKLFKELEALWSQKKDSPINEWETNLNSAERQTIIPTNFQKPIKSLSSDAFLISFNDFISSLERNTTQLSPIETLVKQVIDLKYSTVSYLSDSSCQSFYSIKLYGVMGIFLSVLNLVAIKWKDGQINSTCLSSMCIGFLKVLNHIKNRNIADKQVDELANQLMCLEFKESAFLLCCKLSPKKCEIDWTRYISECLSRLMFDERNVSISTSFLSLVSPWSESIFSSIFDGLMQNNRNVSVRILTTFLTQNYGLYQNYIFHKQHSSWCDFLGWEDFDTGSDIRPDQLLSRFKTSVLAGKLNDPQKWTIDGLLNFCSFYKADLFEIMRIYLVGFIYHRFFKASCIDERFGFSEYVLHPASKDFSKKLLMELFGLAPGYCYEYLVGIAEILFKIDPDLSSAEIRPIARFCRFRSEIYSILNNYSRKYRVSPEEQKTYKYQLHKSLEIISPQIDVAAPNPDGFPTFIDLSTIRNRLPLSNRLIKTWKVCNFFIIYPQFIRTCTSSDVLNLF
ncbi:hypothetical protein RF11_02945 [Thelohanellus kitauei]|uniref:Uncharacterized protein n=1 Tax=Thelohanellus kitauei TaxID=669202 RepID=A0A0C2J282_THEKT|nr:hypothetical protein RF11_02945 [Thelohanellus kitauei]